MIERQNDRARTETTIKARTRSRDRIPADIQELRMRRAELKRARKASKRRAPVS